MDDQVLLSSVSLNGVREQSGFGQPLHTLYQQMCSLLHSELGAEAARLLAEPVVDRVRNRIDWYTQGDAEQTPTTLREVPEVEREAMLAHVHEQLGRGREVAERYLASGNAQRAQLGAALRAILDVVRDEQILLLNGQPRIVHWGFTTDSAWTVLPTTVAKVPGAMPLSSASPAASAMPSETVSAAAPQMSPHSPPLAAAQFAASGVAPALQPAVSEEPAALEVAEVATSVAPALQPAASEEPAALEVAEAATSVAPALQPAASEEPAALEVAEVATSVAPALQPATSEEPAAVEKEVAASSISDTRPVVQSSSSTSYFWLALLLLLIVAIAIFFWDRSGQPLPWVATPQPTLAPSDAAHEQQPQQSPVTRTPSRELAPTTPLAPVSSAPATAPITQAGQSQPSAPAGSPQAIPESRTASQIPEQAGAATASSASPTLENVLAAAPAQSQPSAPAGSPQAIPESPTASQTPEQAGAATASSASPTLENVLAAAPPTATASANPSPAADPLPSPTAPNLAAPEQQSATPSETTAPTQHGAQTPAPQTSEPNLEDVLRDAPNSALPRAETPPIKPTAPTKAENREFDQRLNAHGAASGAINVSLLWNGAADLDLVIACPSGEILDYQNRNSCAGEIDVDANAAWDRLQDKPVENVVWKAGAAAPGTYKIAVRYKPRKDERDPHPTPFQLRLTRDKQVQVFKGKAQPGTITDVTTFTVP